MSGRLGRGHFAPFLGPGQGAKENNMLVMLFNIKWNTDGKNADLPDQLFMEVPDTADMDEEGADFLSDQFGATVREFCWIKVDD